MLLLFENIDTEIDPVTMRKIGVFLNSLSDNHRGKDNAIKSAVIEERLNLPGTKVRAITRICRMNGYPVGTSSKGYYWCDNLQELSDVISSLEQRAKAILAAAEGLKAKRFHVTTGRGVL